MELRFEVHDDYDVLLLSGRLDLVSSSTMKDKIRERLQDHHLQFVIRCDDLKFVNSSGLGALISIQKDVKLSGGRMVLCCMPPYVDELFTITGLKKIFEIYASVDDAVASITHPSSFRVPSN